MMGWAYRPGEAHPSLSGPELGGAIPSHGELLFRFSRCTTVHPGDLDDEGDPDGRVASLLRSRHHFNQGGVRGLSTPRRGESPTPDISLRRVWCTPLLSRKHAHWLRTTASSGCAAQPCARCHMSPNRTKRSTAGRRFAWRRMSGSTSSGRMSKSAISLRPRHTLPKPPMWLACQSLFLGLQVGLGLGLGLV